ncbi:MAG: hypothetical protein KF752_19950 [Pirellulaceae bacterium]|nr:hypothetical protein [Pirellulaceae bacterium]
MAGDKVTSEVVDARHVYAQRLAEAVGNLSRLQRLLGQLVRIRTLIFAGVVVALFLAYVGQIVPHVLSPLGWSLAVAFLVAIIRNEHLRFRHLESSHDIDFWERMIARIDRNWSRLPAQGWLPEVTPPAYADDLDIAGGCSLLSLLSLAGTHPGQAVLQRWLCDVPTWEQVHQRQNSVQALSSVRDFRLELVRRISNIGFGASQPYELVQWAQSPSWLKQHPLAHLLSRVGPGILLSGAGMLACGLWRGIPWLTNAGFIGLAMGAVTNILVTLLWGGWIHAVFQRVIGQHQATRQFTQVFSMLEQLPNDGGLLQRIRQTCTREPTCAVIGYQSLNRRIRWASLQNSALLYLPYLILQLLLLWDFRVMRWLEAWKRRFGSSVHSWFEALGRCEALTSAATLADENPDWAYPITQQQPEYLLDARQLGHPLIAASKRVVNDVQLTGIGPLLLITGSNMAGKSTFIRAVGVNLLLARTGSPTCAAYLAVPIYELASSIRIRDSLQDGVSFYMAELNRLKTIVDTARQHSQPEQPRLFFLLDEILQGTNSRERQIAVSRVLQQLINLGAVGLLSTHDLELAKVAPLSELAQVVHFREYFESDASGRQVMRFDYRLRPGATPTTNALKLLSIVGLDPDHQTP